MISSPTSRRERFGALRSKMSVPGIKGLKRNPCPLRKFRAVPNTSPVEMPLHPTNPLCGEPAKSMVSEAQRVEDLIAEPLPDATPVTKPVQTIQSLHNNPTLGDRLTLPLSTAPVFLTHNTGKLRALGRLDPSARGGPGSSQAHSRGPVAQKGSPSSV